MGRMWTVGEVAEMAGVTVRTLHHYDDIGLLSPTDRTDAGYRLYARNDVERLHDVLLFRELGLSLEAIAHALDDPTFDRATALRAHRASLVERMEQTRGLLRAVDRTIESLQRGGEMDTQEMFEGFEDFDHATHEAEAEERWGDTDEWKESERRTRNYGKADWSRMKEEQEDIWRRMAGLLEEEADPTGQKAMNIAEEARLLIDRWFYPCSHAMHSSLASMYATDERFRAFYEDRAEGLAAFTVAAIRANEGRSG